MEQMRLPKNYKTPKQMAEELDVSEKTIYRMCQSGQLPSYRIGGRWRIYEEAELLVEDSDMVLQQFKQGMKKAGCWKFAGSCYERICLESCTKSHLIFLPKHYSFWGLLFLRLAPSQLYALGRPVQLVNLG